MKVILIISSLMKGPERGTIPSTACEGGGFPAACISCTGAALGKGPQGIPELRELGTKKLQAFFFLSEIGLLHSNDIK